MAVANRQKTTKEVLILDNGDELNVTLIRGGFRVKDQEAFAAALEKAPYQTKRAEKTVATLKAALDEAIEQQLPEEEYQARLEALAEHSRKQEEFLATVDLGILVSIAAWDLALTEEDEAAMNFVSLSDEGLKSLHPLLRVDIFSKAMEKLRGRSDSEKKDSSASSNGDSLIQKDSKALSLVSGPDTRSLCDTDSGPASLESGMLLSLTKPS